MTRIFSKAVCHVCVENRKSLTLKVTALAEGSSNTDESIPANSCGLADLRTENRIEKKEPILTVKKQELLRGLKRRF